MTPSAIVVTSGAPAALVSAPCPKHTLRKAARRLFDGSVKDDFLTRADPREAGLDGAALDALIDGAERAGSDSLLLIKDGKIVIERETPNAGPMELRSITKGIAALAVLALISDGAIPSLDEPLSTYFIEFAADDKSRITLRHVMSHTSGLRHAKTNADALNAEPDRTAYARALSVVDPPGSVFSYSNEATQLLSGVIAQAAHESPDSYVKRRIFDSLAIADFSWKRDRAGNVQTYYGLSLRARDLAKVGLLLLGNGAYEGKRVLPQKLVRELFEPGSRYGGYGLCFWLDPRVTQAADKLAAIQLSEADRKALGPLTGRPFESSEAYFFEAKRVVGAAPYARVRTLHRERKGPLETLPGQASALIALGGLGQRLELHPDSALIAVRQHRRRLGDDSRESLVTFRAMQELLFRISRPCSR